MQRRFLPSRSVIYATAPRSCIERLKRGDIGFGAAALLALMALLALLRPTRPARTGVTFDEVYPHPRRLHVFLHGGPFFDRGHPPLALYLYALALPGGLTVDKDDQTWGRDEAGYGARFLSGQTVPMQTLVFRARLVVIALSLILAFCVSEVARRRWGESAGLLVLALFAASPDLIAHGHLATSDLAAALAMFGAGVALHRFAERPDGRRTVVAAVAVALAFLTKFTTIPLALVAVGVPASPSRGPTLKPLLRLGAATLAAVLFLGMASFGFHSGSLGEDLHITANDHPELARAALEHAAQLLHTSAPRLLAMRIPGYLLFKNVGFLVGRSLAPQLFSDGWNYLPGRAIRRQRLALLLRGHVPAEDAAAVSGAHDPGRMRAAGGRLAALDSGARLLRGLSRQWTANVGHRHLLPIYPWLIAADGVAWPGPRRKPWIRFGAVGAGRARHRVGGPGASLRAELPERSGRAARRQLVAADRLQHRLGAGPPASGGVAARAPNRADSRGLAHLVAARRAGHPGGRVPLVGGEEHHLRLLARDGDNEKMGLAAGPKA